ncbi:MAG: MerR family transcriptional regulator [Eubacteriales bacterium]|nr:MerR family transcriptional regulator [Eubacteriales bacterium]
MYTVKQAAQKMELSEHTLRYYANEGLFPHITRDAHNVRLFSEEDLEWVALVRCLRRTGMPLDEVKHFIGLCLQGDGTARERYDIILRQRETALAEMEQMKERLVLLERKVAYYGELVEKTEKK